MGVDYEIGEAQQDGLLTLFPLLVAAGGVGTAGTSAAGEDVGGSAGSHAGSHVAWLSLADAVADGRLEITEVGGGVVAELEAVNRAPSHVLILDGEQLIGAKQNRTTSRTILVGRSSVTRIPVSCMEQGRWRHRTRSMTGSAYHSPAKVRKHARRVEAEADAMSADADSRDGGAGDAADPSRLLSRAQGQVWASIADSSAKYGVHSATGALDEVYQGSRETLDERASRFSPLSGQVGVLAFAGDAPLGADIVADAATFARLHGRLVRGYLFDALERELDLEMARRERRTRGTRGVDPAAADTPAPVHLAAAEAFLREVAESRRKPLPTAGLGEYRVLIGAVVGGELEWDGRVIHVSAFPAE